MVNIARFYYNYRVAGPDKKTPAMRIGLVKKLVYPRDLFTLK